MSRNPSKSFARPRLETLEDRINLSPPTFFTDVKLPGYLGTWDYSRVGQAASPVFADLDGNGTDEILAPAPNGRLYAYTWNASTNQVNAFREYVPTGGGQLMSTPVVTTLPGGVKAVFIGTQTGAVWGFNAVTGAVLPGWPKNVGYQEPGYPLFPADTVLGHLAAGDLDGDGSPEIVATSLNQLVTAFRADGSVYWRHSNDDTIFGGVVIADLNADGRSEVVFGGDSTASQYYPAGGRITALSSTGRRLWVKNTDQVIWSSPTAADLNGDGKLEVIVGTGYFYNNVGNKVYALDSDGNDLPGWPYVTDPNPGISAQVYSSPAVADLNGDKWLDVVFGDGRGRLHAVSGNPADLVSGQPKKLWVVQAFAVSSRLYSSPVIADIDGNGALDVVIGDSNGFLRGFNGGNGAQIFQYTLNPQTGVGAQYLNAPGVGRFRPGGGLQLAALPINTQIGVKVLSPGQILLFDLDASTAAPAWPMFRNDTQANAVARPDSLPAGYFSITSLVQALYQGALQRNPTPAELNGTWLPALRHAGSLRGGVLAIVGSPEARDVRISGWYSNYLSRAPEAGALGAAGNLQAAMRAGASDADLQAGIVASDEAFSKAGGNNQAWVNFLYTKVLGRSPAGGESAGWVAVLNGSPGLGTRVQVARGFLLSREYTEKLVVGWYVKYTGSAPPADALEALGMDLRRGKTEERGVADLLLSSQGDYAATQQEASWVRALYRDLLGRAISPAETASVLRAFQGGASYFNLAKGVLQSDEYLGRLITGWFVRYLGRAPVGTEVSARISGLRAGISRAEVIRGLIASNEYWLNRAQGNLNNFIGAVSNDLLGYGPDSTALSYWTNRQAQFGDVRSFMPAQLLAGLYEGRYFKLTLTEWYLALLRRLPETPSYGGRILTTSSPFGAQVFVNAWANGTNPEDIQAVLLGSGEYLQLARDKAFWTGGRWLS